MHGLAETLADLDARGLRRRLRVLERADGRTAVYQGRELLNFASNNYLGLTNHPKLKEAAANAAREFGVGGGASRLISGTLELHEQLETEIAAFKGTEAALVFPTGFMAAIGAITALCHEPRPIFMDKLNHASLIDGARLAERMTPGTTLRTFAHAKLDRLRELLERWREDGESHKAGTAPLIVTDALFSMDGDLADLPGLCALAREFGATLMIDEAHGMGVFGEHGRGVAEALLGVEHDGDVHIHMGTLSKALGGLGGTIAGSRALIELLINRARSFIYTTAPPPPVIAAARAALEVVRSEEGRRLRRRLLAGADKLREHLKELRLDTGASASQIIPIILGDNDRTMRVAEKLLDAGFLVGAVRPPSVPPGRARLRVSLTAAHTDEDIERLAAALERALAT